MVGAPRFTIFPAKLSELLLVHLHPDINSIGVLVERGCGAGCPDVVASFGRSHLVLTTRLAQAFVRRTPRCRGGAGYGVFVIRVEVVMLATGQSPQLRSAFSVERILLR